MAAATLSLSFSLDPQHQLPHHFCCGTHFKPHQTLLFNSPTPLPKYPLLLNPKSDRYIVKSSSSSSPPSPSTTAPDTEPEPEPELASPYLVDTLGTGRFLTNEELEKLKFLEGFSYSLELESGILWVRVMRAEEMDMTIALLAESFAESMVLPTAYDTLLRFFIKQYLIERRALMPHAVTLVGFFRKKKQDNAGEEDEEEEAEELAGTVEVSFDKRGANTSPPTPTPPKNAPYICNMTVKHQLRRRGIGWHLLKASEELISQMSSTREVYLHCRMIDEAPFNMYIKAGYHVVKTDTILILLMLQRRKHLMCKKLPVVMSPVESDEEWR
ncbi:GCN5-related N-acetyltransferase 5, chloroplastic [Humulus lupulus]|uniref:GCN5-related N-acetyltransferase 5, chloroplastic n=1 Tax=Humulus lupulus TaxID=3486 RepID=UPI002B4019D5|nr:GCN5-related N-acetyltransferase 5, chloroplastic [Humulus lupulus]